MSHISRRDVLSLTAGSVAAAALASPARAAESPAEPWGYCLNTSTIRGQKVPLVEEVEIAAKAGYQGFEPWINELEQFVKEGGSLKDLAKRVSDLGLSVEDGIGFAEWIVDDDARRQKGLETAKRAMDLMQQLGGKRLAAPPVGATDLANIDLLRAADRYRALLDLGESMGVTPQVEHWGHSKSVRRLGEALLIAAESHHPKACVLPDVYHLHKGGSDFGGLRLLGRATIGIFHVNDYPAMPGPAGLTDAHRVYPGDGVAPWNQLLLDLRDSGYRGMLSLELFNRDYWKQDAFLVAKTGLEKLRAVVRASLA